MAQLHTKFEELLKQLASALELSPPLLEKDQICKFLISENYELLFKPFSDDFVASCVIGAYPTKNREDFLILVMRANFLGQGTGGSIIGVDKEEKFLTLSSPISYEIEFKPFRELIEDFLNFVEYWREELDKHETMMITPFG